MLRAVVFDFDGVLANSEPLHFRSFRDVLATQDILLTETDYYARYLGFDDAGAFVAIGKDHRREWSREEIGGFVWQKAEMMTELERHASVLFPGAAEIVRQTAAAIPIAIASGALGHEIRRVLDREELTTCFSAIVAAEDTPRSKPAPDPYERAVALLRGSSLGNLKAHECVAVEDSVWGLQSAREAGLRTIGVAQSYPADELPADFVITSISEFDIARVRSLIDS
ncbi:MAG TPA: HAD family phosphatase [Vicinamibacterales bacterium]|jgi:HAD superfamily hydrolase (TIGR01509 family)